jgi:type II secretory pathway pseudopilin PulG
MEGPGLWVVVGVFLLFTLGLLVLLWIRCVREWIEDNKDLIQAVASLFGVLAVFAALAGLFLTFRQQQDAAQQQRIAAQTQAESAAASLLQEHLVLATERPELNTQQKPDVVEKRFISPKEAVAHPTTAPLSPDYAFFSSHAMFAAQTIYGLMHGKEWESDDWQNTVQVLIWNHNTYVCHEDAFNPDEYTSQFTELIGTLKPLGLCKPRVILRSPFLPDDYRLDETDSDEVVLRRRDGSEVAVFDATGADPREIEERAWEDFRGRGEGSRPEAGG